jgi:phage host-nuclease inhibitor protein Gam
MEALKKSDSAAALPLLATREEAAAAVKKHAHLLASLGVYMADRDKAVQTASETNSTVISATSAQITALEQQLEQWAKTNRKEFGEQQSLEFSHGFLKFRLGQRKLVCLARWTQEKVIKKLTSFPVTSMWQEFVRRDPEINAQKLLAETKPGGRLPAARLKEIGLKITRDERFEVEPKPDMVAKDCDLMP